MVVTTSGLFTGPEHARLVQAILSRPFWKPGLDVVFDHRRMEFNRTDFETMMSAGETHEAHDDQIGDGRAAIVFKNRADYGTGRIFENITEGNIQAKLRLFTDIEKAHEWIRSPKE